MTPQQDASQAFGTAEHRTRTPRPWVWLAVLIVATLSVGAIAATIGPLRDPDLYWHIRLGEELLDGVSIYDAGRDWSFAPVEYTWVSTQWIVELLFAWLENLAGFSGLVAYRTLTTLLTILTLSLVIFRQTRVWAALVVIGLPVITLIIFAQERPQQISFIILPIVGYWWLRAVRDGIAPRWWILLPLSAVWANCHGLWIMLPVVLALAFVGRLLDHGRSDPALRPLAIGTLVSVLGGCITPVGPLNLLAPIRFAGTTAHIKEWEPTNFIYPASYGFSAMVVLMVIAWARGRNRSRTSAGSADMRTPRSEILFVVAIALLTASASRNICTGVLLLAPVLAWRLSKSFAGPRPRAMPVGLKRVAKPYALVVSGLAVVMAGFVVALSVPIPAGTAPVGLISEIAHNPLQSRVLNTYNAGGLVLWFARPDVSQSETKLGDDGANHFVQVGIDGRADRYGAAYIQEYLAMLRGTPGWELSVAQLKPDVALLADDEALVPLLQSQGWQVKGQEAGYVLLTPPGRAT